MVAVPCGAMESAKKTLTEVLLAAQRAGSLGNRPIEDVIDHARQFVDAIPTDARSVIDIGSGAGVPGLVIATDLPALSVTLVDRRATRIDALRRAVSAMGLAHRVTVIAADAEVLAKDPDHSGRYDVAVCRGLGAPIYTATLSRPFLRDGGSLIVSEPPNSDQNRWPETLLVATGFISAVRIGAVSRLTASNAR